MSVTTEDEPVDRCIVLSIPKKEKRAGLFKFVDQPEYADRVIDRTASKRVIATSLFDELQFKIDSYPQARVSLVDRFDDGSYRSIDYASDAKPRTDQYNGILRRLRT